jgi:hypothetical protein
LSDGKQGAYARALELSTTGAVLKLLGDRGSLALAGAAPLTMLLFLPEAAPHVAALARRVRKIGELDAFEFVEMPAAERLTLAEHLDRLVFGRAGVELLRGNRMRALRIQNFVRLALTLREPHARGQGPGSPTPTPPAAPPEPNPKPEPERPVEPEPPSRYPTYEDPPPFEPRDRVSARKRAS